MLRDRSKQMSVLSTENLKRGMKTSLNNFGSKLNATSQTKELTSVHQSLDFKKQEGTGMQNIEKYIGMNNYKSVQKPHFRYQDEPEEERLKHREMQLNKFKTNLTYLTSLKDENELREFANKNVNRSSVEVSDGIYRIFRNTFKK